MSQNTTIHFYIKAACFTTLVKDYTAYLRQKPRQFRTVVKKYFNNFFFFFFFYKFALMNSSLKYLKILSGLYKHSVEPLMLCAPPKDLFLFVLKIVLNHLSLLNLFIHGKQPTLSSRIWTHCVLILFVGMLRRADVSGFTATRFYFLRNSSLHEAEWATWPLQKIWELFNKLNSCHMSYFIIFVAIEIWWETFRKPYFSFQVSDKIQPQLLLSFTCTDWEIKKKKVSEGWNAISSVQSD